GLHSDPAIQTIEVVSQPPWLNDGLGQQTNNSIKFDAQNFQYDLTFDDKLVDEHKTVNDIFTQPMQPPPNIPLVGDLDNEFLAEVKVTATAPLAPSAVIQADATAHALVEVLGQSLFDHTYDLTGSQQVTDHVNVVTHLQIDGLTLQPSIFTLGFQLKDLPLFHYESPEIPIVSLGVPDVVSIQASVQFGIDVTLNAALTLGFDLDPQHLGQIGLVSPTYIEPKVTLSAILSGEVQVVGFDLAKLAG